MPKTMSGQVAQLSPDRRVIERVFDLGPTPRPAAASWLPVEEIFDELAHGYAHGRPTIDIGPDKVTIRHPAEVVVKTLSLSEPRWAGPEQSPGTTAIEALCIFSHYKREVPFLAHPNDVEPHGRELYARLIAGDFGLIGAFKPR